MKKRFLMFLMVTVFAFGLLTPAVLSTNEINATIDGIAVSFEGEPPIIVDGRTLVPVRAVFEALDLDVWWLPKERAARLFDDNFEVIIPVESNIFTAMV